MLVDLQRDFLDAPGGDAPMPVAGTGAVIAAIAKLARTFRRRGLPIVHAVRLYRPDGSNVDLVRRCAIEQGARIAVSGSPGSQIAAELVPKVVELDVMHKPRWGAFCDFRIVQVSAAMSGPRRARDAGLAGGLARR